MSLSLSPFFFLSLSQSFSLSLSLSLSLIFCPSIPLPPYSVCLSHLSSHFDTHSFNVLFLIHAHSFSFILLYFRSHLLFFFLSLSLLFSLLKWHSFNLPNRLTFLSIITFISVYIETGQQTSSSSLTFNIGNSVNPQTRLWKVKTKHLLLCRKFSLVSGTTRVITGS